MRMQRFLISLGVVWAVVAAAKTASAVPVATVDPEMHGFGSVTLGAQPTTTFTVANSAPSGEGNSLTVTAITKSGTGCAPVSASPESFTVAGGTSQVVTVTYAPVVPGSTNCTLTLTSNHATPLTFTAIGTGVGPVMATDPASLPFGEVNVGSSSTAQTVTITNSGNAPLNYTAIVVAGNTDYKVMPASGTVAGGATATVNVTFHPIQPGARPGTLRISGDAFANPSDDIDLSGTGRGATMVVTWTGQPDPLDFGSVQISSGFSERTVNVANTGNETLTLSAIEITAGGSEFSTTEMPGITVAAGANRDLTVRFDPDTGFGRAGNLRIGGNAPGSPVNVALAGTGLTRVVSPSPLSLTFGNVNVGTPSAPQTVTITNPGNTPLTITRLDLTNTNFEFNGATCSSGQVCQPGTPFTIDGGGTADIQVGVRCNPATFGAHNGNLTITGNQDSGTSSVALSCTGRAPDISAPNPASLSFGNVVVGQTPTQTFSFQNNGNADLTYSITLPSGYEVPGPGCTSGCTLAASASRTVTVRFTPVARQLYSGNVTITSNDPDTPTRTVAVSGTGIAPVIGNPVPPSRTVAFGLVDVGTNSTNQTISVQNVGDSVLNVTSVTLTGGQANQFSIQSGQTGAHTVAAGATASWQVRCSPTSIGDKSTTFRIASDALGATTYDFTLTCTGQQAQFTFAPAGGLDFGGVPVGTSSTRSATITNTGNKTGTVQSIVSNNGVFTFAVQGGNPPRVVAAGASITVDVTFTPVNGNVISSSLTVMTDGSPTSFTIPLVGDGETQGVDITVENENDLDVDLGPIRVNTMTPRRVTVRNTGDTGYTLSTPTSNSARCAIQPITPATLPTVIPGGGQVTFDVRVTPNALGAGACTITVQSSIPTTDTIQFQWTGVAPEVALASPPDGILDYAGVDVDAPATIQAIRIDNTGSFQLTISGCTLTGSSRFALQTSCNNVVVPVGGSATFDVAFDPAVEAIEAAQLTFAVDALSTNQVVVMLRGVGVDQNLVLPALAYEFADTFRNPDPDDAPVEMVAVTNPVHPVTGAGAPLTVSMVIVQDAVAAVFALESAGPFTVAPGGTLELPVTFRPTAYGLFDGTLTIMNDTTGREMATVTLRGRGVSREVQVSPQAEYDLGTTGVGIPVRLSDFLDDGIRIQNIDTMGRGYRIRELRLVDDDGDPVTDTPFRLIAPDPRDLAPSGLVAYDVEMVAERAGTFEVRVAVYLDGDPDPHAFVPLTGRAVDVELKGGGGCQAGGGGPGTLALVAGALAALGLARRRRAAATAGLVAAALAGAAALAAADRTRNLELSTFAPAPATEVEGFAVESPLVGVDGAWSLGLSISHATNVLTVVSPQLPGMTDVPIKARTALQLGFAYAFAGRFEAGVRLPMYQQSGDEPQFSGLKPAEGNAIGDVGAHVKARLADTGAVALAASVGVTAPTATADQVAGADGPSGHVRAIGGWRGGRAGVTVNAGFVARGAGELGDVTQGHALTYGGAAWVRALDALWVIGETFGASGLGSEGGGVQQLEGALGIRYEVGGTVGVSVGVGRGILQGIGSPDLRGFAMVDVAPKARDPGPLVVRPPPPPRDEGDDDGDGIVNADDRCRYEAEDVDGYQDEDGCPDPDNDGDGLPDGLDRCPLEAEDLDGFEDEDGCPDPDNDRDGIPDVDDKCPNEPEDVDGFMDHDGCDDPDNDGDGIPDVIDQCVLEPETINGVQDDDGCPDLGESLVMVMPDRIEIFEPVAFQGTTAKLAKASHVLGQVAATMRANRDFKRLRITVHVHPRGASDQELSEQRAEAVRAWMLQWGVEPERLEVRGMGSSRPLVPKTQKGAAALNDRVEFIILEKAVK